MLQNTTVWSNKLTYLVLQRQWLLYSLSNKLQYEDLTKNSDKTSTRTPPLNMCLEEVLTIHPRVAHSWLAHNIYIRRPHQTTTMHDALAMFRPAQICMYT